MNLDSSLYSLPKKIETRWASPENPDGLKGEGAKTFDGRKGRPCLPLKAGEKLVLAHASGASGVVRRIWLTIDERTPNFLRGVRIDIYWDGATTPAISAPLGDFFGQGLGRCQTFQSVFFSNPEGRSFNSVVPMPFRTGFRIVATNETASDIKLLFYDVNYTLGDEIPEPVYLHAHWRRENPTKIRQDYVVLPPVQGRGRYLGANFSVLANRATYFQSWWGEGECKFFLDGDTTHPTLAGTGTEDYIGTAWGQGQYAHLYQGCHHADWDNLSYAFYRYHAPDPIYFHRDIRVTFQQIGGTFGDNVALMDKQGVCLEHAGEKLGQMVNMKMPSLPDGEFALFERDDDWSSCCYFYLDRPENGLPALAHLEERVRGLAASSA